jgi:hypothetical protein
MKSKALTRLCIGKYIYVINIYHCPLSEIQREKLSLCIICIFVPVLLSFVFSVDVGEF